MRDGAVHNKMRWRVLAGVFVLVVGTGCTTFLRDCCCCIEEEKPVKCGSPVTDAGNGQLVTVGQSVVLHGGVRFPSEDNRVCMSERETLRYQWEQVSGPLVSIRHANQREASFVPKIASEHMFRFQAIYPVTALNFKPKTSEWAYTKVIVRQLECDPPTADAGTDQIRATI